MIPPTAAPPITPAGLPSVSMADGSAEILVDEMTDIPDAVEMDMVVVDTDVTALMIDVET
ncbi:hypothetical protein TI04_08445 [Achromatium sp. WMS2]|nr:hypothetical protein TI04_08445 [Achromatium sp. WMS2]